MHSSPVPWKVLSSRVGVGILTEGWTLHTAESNAGEESRCFRVDVDFASAFSSVPVVQLGITGFDIDERDTARITLNAAQITQTGFQVEVWTWAGTRVYAVEFNWFAIGA